MSGSESETVFDVIVIGGGITGAGVARDAALRGLSCLLLEKGDFASGVSSKSTRLIHGGLRYLANFEIDLVAESLRERAVLRRLAPHLIRPIPLVIPIYKGDAHGRAAVSLGISLYDLLSRDDDVPRYFTSGREKTLALEPRLSREGLKGSALFYDHQIMMPERLVLENVISAREAGAAVRNYSPVERIEEGTGTVSVTARDAFSGSAMMFRSRVVVNASGPWIDSIRRAGNINGNKIIFPTKGVHLVLPKLTDQALFITSGDNRMFFVLPLEQYSLIGTTDTRYTGDLDDVHAEREDVEYLVRESRRVLPGLNISRETVLYTYSGVRPLAFSGSNESKISRKHRVIPEGKTGRIITIAGGKLTTYRSMAKDAVDAVCRLLGVKASCVTDRKPFPGGLPMPFDDYVKQVVPDMAARHGVSLNTAQHIVHFYGSRAEQVLGLANADAALRETVSTRSGDIYAQVAYSIREEGARTLSDIVLRRMHTGMTAGRGSGRIREIAAVAARELKWTAEEAKLQVGNFLGEISRDVECLRQAG